MLLLTSNQKCQSTEGKSWCTKQLIFRQFFTLETGSWEADGDSTASLHQREVVDLLNVTCPSCSQHSHEQHQVAVTGQRSGTADPVQCWTCVNTAMLQWHCRPCTVLNLRQHSHASVTLQTLYSVEPTITQPCFSDTTDLVQCWTYVNTAMLQWQCRPCTVLNLRQHSRASVILQTLYSAVWFKLIVTVTKMRNNWKISLS